MSKMFESFSIPLTEGYKTVDAGKNTIRIKGVALKGDEISRNNRKYVAKELKKATNTFINKPVNINHNDKNKVGHITWMDYDEASELLTYEAEINDPKIVGLLRSKSTDIKGVSIQADYLYCNCARCGKQFLSEEDWYTHCTGEHFMKDLPKEPHGIIGNGLALVLSPEVPGFTGTSVELMEMRMREISRLSETITNYEKKKEDYRMSKIALEKETSVSIGKSGMIVAGKISAEKPEQTPAKTEAPPIIEAPVSVASEPGLPSTPSITETVKPITLRESHIATVAATEKTKLSLGEPFAGYTDFADCVAKNSDKSNPEAYCGSIKHETEDKETLRKRLDAVEAKQNEIIAELNKPLVFEHKEQKFKDDLGWKEIKVPDVSGFATKEMVEAIKIPEPTPPYDDKQIKEFISAHKDFDASDILKRLDDMEARFKEYDTIKQAVRIADQSVTASHGETLTVKEENKQLKERIEALEKKQLNETIRLDNVEDKVKPQYKDSANPLDLQKKKTNPDFTYKPGGK